jgi:ATP-dependent RNA helicase RhlE
LTDIDTTTLPAEAFLALGIEESYLYRLDKQGITTPTDIQTQAIPQVFEGRDLVARAPTGSGKSAAFLLPILQRTWSDQARMVLEPGMPRSLILVPTRELAAQLGRMARALQPPKTTQPCEITGGVPYPPQFRLLDRPQPIIIATPGRLIDLMDDQRISLSMLETLVLDEADRMLEMGFTEALDQVLAAAPETCQKLLFSATVPRWVERAASRFLTDPARVEVGARHGNTPQIEQGVYYCSNERKGDVLKVLLEDEALTKVVVFVNAKVKADELEKDLRKAGIKATSLHGDHNQSTRRKALARFRDDEVRVLVASDVAARGVDLPAVSHVINFDMPRELETYVHRIGRTGRAQQEGVAIALCDAFEMPMIRLIERKQGIELVVLADELPAKAKQKKAKGSKHLRPEWSNKRGPRKAEEDREDRVYASGFDPDDEARRSHAGGHKKRASNADARPMSGFKPARRDRDGYGDKPAGRSGGTFAGGFAGKPGGKPGRRPSVAADADGYGRKERAPRPGRPERGAWQERPERGERPERRERSERGAWQERPERGERPERRDRPERPEREQRESWGERPTRSGKPEYKSASQRDGRRKPSAASEGRFARSAGKPGAKAGGPGKRFGGKSQGFDAPKSKGKAFANAGPVRPKRQAARGSYIDAALDRAFGRETDEG